MLWAFFITATPAGNVGEEPPSRRVEEGMINMEDPNADPNVNPNPAPEGDPPKEPAKTFTQEEVNALMGRVRAEAKAPFQDYDTLKERAAKADELERAQMTEAQKMAADLEQEKRTNADLKGSIANVNISAEVKVQAAKMGIVDPDAALLLVNRSGITYSAENGVQGAEEALKTLVGEKAYLVGTGPLPPDLNRGPGEPGPLTPTLTPEQKEQARKFGMKEEEYAKGIVVA
tara:strand:- start:3350 stop:4042 length:693 start_codon:yes stop_codon:yes gene_type:complete